MKRPSHIFPALLMGLLFLGGVTANAADTHVVVIDYGQDRDRRRVEVPFEKGRSALEVLQAAATVETHPVEHLVFVTAIDGVRGKRGETAWYYTVDGQAARELAYANRLEQAARITWIYQKDVCSGKVNGELINGRR